MSEGFIACMCFTSFALMAQSGVVMSVSEGGEGHSAFEWMDHGICQTEGREVKVRRQNLTQVGRPGGTDESGYIGACDAMRRRRKTTSAAKTKVKKKSGEKGKGTGESPSRKR